MRTYNVNNGFWARFNRWEPYIAIRLIILNCFVFVVTFIGVANPVNVGALEFYKVVENGQYWRIFTAMFLHGSPMHLFMNMLMLFFLGSMVERAFGRALFFIIYMGAGYMGFIAALVFQEPSHVTIGASGAVLGLFGAWLAFERSKRVSFKQMWHTPSGQRVLILFIIWVLPSFAPKQQVSYWGHIGGFVGGYLLGMFCSSLGYRGKTLPLHGRLALGIFVVLCAAGLVWMNVYKHA
jgi:rhomboid protease GluP